MEKVKYFYYIIVYSLLILQYNTNYRPKRNLSEFEFLLRNI